MKSAVALYRVSTERQGKSGLGLDAQKETVALYKNLVGIEIIKEYTEIVSGKETKRPILNNAIRYCEKHDCVLVIAKLDRLARNVGLILYLLEKGVKFVIADKPLADRWDKDDKTHIFKASAQAAKASAYLNELTNAKIELEPA